MKKMRIMFMLMSLSFVLTMSAAPTITDKNMKARGQPPTKESYNVSELYAPVNVEYADVNLSVVNFEMPYAGIVAKNATAKNENTKAINAGIRKVRDVDLCSTGGLYSNKNTDKRAGIRNKTQRLARGQGPNWNSVA